MSATNNDEQYIFETKPPTSDEHYELRVQAGLTPPPRPESDTSLRNTWYGVTVRTRGDGTAVGMGRIIGDGAVFLTVVDMAILPTHQRKGLGGKIMRLLLDYVDANAPRAYLTLLADPPGVGLYKRNGFVVDTYETPMMRSQYMAAILKQREAERAKAS